MGKNCYSDGSLDFGGGAAVTEAAEFNSIDDLKEFSDISNVHFGCSVKFTLRVVLDQFYSWAYL